jgi:hypothetical protein
MKEKFSSGWNEPWSAHDSNDSAIREAAKATEIYPWADKIKGEVKILPD